MKKNILPLVLITIVLVVIGLWLKRKPGESKNLDSFAKCLAEKGWTMYGAAWCPHCRNQKLLFGTSWQYIPYVECPDNPKLCTEKGVTGYPTWIASGSARLEGEQSLSRLSEASGCSL